MKNRFKLVFVTQNLAPFRLAWLSELARVMDVVVYHLNDYDRSVNSKYLNVTADGINVKTEYVNLFGIKFFGHAKILKENADMLLLDGYGFVGQVALIAYLRAKRIDFYMTVDGGILPLKGKIVKHLLKRFCMNSPKAIFSTSELTDEFIRRYKTSAAPIVRHYFSSVYRSDIHCPTAEEKLSCKRRLGLENRFVVLTVGRFVAIKGFDILLRTAELAADDVCFVFVGGRPTDEYLAISKNIAPNKVRFVDFMSRSELKAYYYASDIFAMPSRGDVWGLVVGEAMACGLPIISSDKCIAGASMISDHVNGFVISGERPESYHEKIVELKNAPTLIADMSANNCELMGKYALDTSSKNDIDNFERLTGAMITGR